MHRFPRSRFSGLLAPAAHAGRTPPARRGADDAGATSVEYALMASLIAAVIVGSVTLLGQEATALFLIPCGALGPC